MRVKWRKVNRVLHRDLGYFFTAMIIIYALSGIALNHMHQWNPNYIITRTKTQLTLPENFDDAPRAAATRMVEQSGVQARYKSHYFPAPGNLKIFLQGGSSLTVQMESGQATIEQIRRRPLFYEVNFLHYNPGKLWLWFSDIFAVALILLAITGLFILKGRNGITRRGAWLTLAGVVVPLVLLFMYLN